jgi:hypothetical protein
MPLQNGRGKNNESKQCKEPDADIGIAERRCNSSIAVEWLCGTA